MNDIKNYLEFAIKAGKKAGKEILYLTADKNKINVKEKGLQDFVTNIDLASENIILKYLQSVTPEFKFYCEESGESGPVNADYTWIIDPVDGTTNLMKGLPLYCISIALKERDQLVAGVVYQPATDYIFYASKGNGAFFNDKRIRVNNQQNLENALLTSHFLRKPAFIESIFAKGCIVRDIGSTALELAYIGAGIIDLKLWTFDNQPLWDTAAGEVILKEAGGIMIDLLSGEPRDRGPYIAGNPILAKKLFHTLSKSEIES